MFSDLDAGLYPPPPPRPILLDSEHRGKPWKTRTKRCARQQNRPGGAFTAFTVHVIHLLFFFLPLHRIGENPIQGAPSLYFHPPVYPTVYPCSVRVCVCVRHRRTRSHLSAREEHGGASRDISLRPKKGSRSHRERQRERERGRDPHRRVKDLLLLLRCHLVPVHNGPGRLLSDCLATFFFPQRREGGSVRDEKGRGRERVKPSRSIAN